MYKYRNQPTAQRKTSQRPLLMFLHDPLLRNHCYLKQYLGCAVGASLGVDALAAWEKGAIAGQVSCKNCEIFSISLCLSAVAWKNVA